MPGGVVHTRARTLARVEAEYRALDRIVRRLGPAEWRRPVFQKETRERWTVKDALAHITAWKANMHRSLAKLPPPRGARPRSLNEANALFYRRSRGRSVAEVVADHRATQRALLRTLRTLPADQFTGRARSVQWPYDLVGHSTEHRTRHIERAAARERT